MTLNMKELRAKGFRRLLSGTERGLLKLLGIGEAWRRLFPRIKIKAALLMRHLENFFRCVGSLPLVHRPIAIFSDVLIEEILCNHLLHLLFPKLDFSLYLGLKSQFIFLLPMLLDLQTLFLVNDAADLPLVFRLNVLGNVFVVIDVSESLAYAPGRLMRTLLLLTVFAVGVFCHG